MLTVTGLARRSGTTTYAVRYYTRMGLLRPERDPDNGYRLYKPREVNWLRFIGRGTSAETNKDQQAGKIPFQDCLPQVGTLNRVCRVGEKTKCCMSVAIVATAVPFTRTLNSP